MGRKRWAREKFKDPIGTMSSQYLEELLTTLASLEELAGFRQRRDDNRAENKVRKRLSSSLKFFHGRYEAFRFEFCQNNSIKRQLMDETLLELEESAAEVRSVIQELSVIIPAEKEEIIALSEATERLSSEVSHDDLPIEQTENYVSAFVQSLASQYNSQLQLEEIIIERLIGILSSLYDDMEEFSNSINHNPPMVLDTIAQSLEHRIRLDSLQWNKLSILIDSLVDSGSDLNFLRRRADSYEPENVAFDQFISTPSPQLSDTDLLSSHPVGTISDAVEEFLCHEAPLSACAKFLLLIGAPGSGKTFNCDQIERRVNECSTDDLCQSVTLVRPSLPLDIMGSSIGASEDVLVSLFSYTLNCNSKCVIILDNVEHLVGEEIRSNTRGGNHMTARIKSTMLSIMDGLRFEKVSKSCRNDILVICTACQTDNELFRRFDQVFHLAPPNVDERRAMIASSVGLDVHNVSFDTDRGKILAAVVEGTVGKSRAEIARLVRMSLVEASATTQQPREDNIAPLYVLQAMKASLKNFVPASLQTSSLDFVDVKVYSAQELLGDETDPSFENRLPALFGDDAAEAWRKLHSLIITPLCQSKALDDILYGGSRSTEQSVCAGVLLSGPPGCGKSAMALHCAKCAASLVNSLSLLDVSCTSLVHKELGQSEKAVRRLFAAARAAAPCILLLDGIEDIAAVLGNDNTTEGTMDRVLSTLLTELDGIDSELRSPQYEKRASIAIIGITHNPDWIDPALRRPGRLEKVIWLKKPDFEARRSIIFDRIQNLPIDFTSGSYGASLRNTQELAVFVAEQCWNWSAAELIAVCNDACIASAKRHIKAENQEGSNATVLVEDFVSAIKFRGKATGPDV